MKVVAGVKVMSCMDCPFSIIKEATADAFYFDYPLAGFTVRCKSLNRRIDPSEAPMPNDCPIEESPKEKEN